MRALLIVAVLIAASPVLENPRVRAYRRTDGSLVGVAHGPGVVIALADRPGVKAGSAVWAEDAASSSTAAGTPRRSIVIVQPLRGPRATTAPAAGSQPGEGTFTGMSFNPLFENDRVSVLRARMEVGAREGFHTHGSDTIVVHLSGGQIEDTANGKTVVNRWKPGDVEFEALGSSHSARNVGGAVDVVLVALKPQ
jgi:quercetin dioxygenase-like cupin family protein